MCSGTMVTGVPLPYITGCNFDYGSTVCENWDHLAAYLAISFPNLQLRLSPHHPGSLRPCEQDIFTLVRLPGTSNTWQVLVLKELDAPKLWLGSLTLHVSGCSKLSGGSLPHLRGWVQILTGSLYSLTLLNGNNGMTLTIIHTITRPSNDSSPSQ